MPKSRSRENLPNYRRGMLITDGVFSMDGDIAPLDKLHVLTREIRVAVHGR